MWPAVCGLQYVACCMWPTVCGLLYVAYIMWPAVCVLFYVPYDKLVPAEIDVIIEKYQN